MHDSGSVIVTNDSGSAIVMTMDRSSRRCVTTVRQPYGNGSATIWQRFGNHMATVRQPYGNGSATIWQRFGIHMATVRQPYGNGSASIWQRFGEWWQAMTDRGLLSVMDRMDGWMDRMDGQPSYGQDGRPAEAGARPGAGPGALTPQ